MHRSILGILLIVMKTLSLVPWKPCHLYLENRVTYTLETLSLVPWKPCHLYLENLVQLCRTPVRLATRVSTTAPVSIMPQAQGSLVTAVTLDTLANCVLMVVTLCHKAYLISFFFRHKYKHTYSVILSSFTEYLVLTLDCIFVWNQNTCQIISIFLTSITFFFSWECSLTFA